MKKYSAISGNGITHNLIYAEMWETLENATKAFDSLTTTNKSDWKWQLRDVNQKIIKQFN
jgi:hypothetical protein